MVVGTDRPLFEPLKFGGVPAEDLIGQNLTSQGAQLPKPSPLRHHISCEDEVGNSYFHYSPSATLEKLIRLTPNGRLGISSRETVMPMLEFLKASIMSLSFTVSGGRTKNRVDVERCGWPFGD